MADNIDGFLRAVGLEPSDENRAILVTKHENMLAALVQMFDDPQVEHTWKMMRTRWREWEVRSDNNPAYVGLPRFARKATFLETFEANFAPRLGPRRDTFRRIFERLAARGRSRTMIVETGCLRIPGNWELDGQSTFQFDEFAHHHGGIVFSVDLTPESVDTARRACSPRTSVVLSDSVTFLHQLSTISKERIDLLYLDSFDVVPGNYLPSAIHHIKELTAAWPLLAPGSIVCVDDYGGGEGKGTLIDDFFRNLGVPAITEGVQKAWVL